MTDFNSNPFWPVWFRILQTALEAAPTLLCGLVLAGLIRGLVKPESLRRWIPADPIAGPIRACLLGFLLPVCSFGVLPVAWELRRAGVARAAVLTFLFTAPLCHPLSLAFALQKLAGHGPAATGVFVGLLALALVALMGGGILLGRWLPEPTAQPPELPALPSDAVDRLAVVGLTAARGITGILPVFLIVGLIGSGLVALFPGGALERAAGDHTVFAPLHMALAALPFQVPPERGDLLLSELLTTGATLGVALVFLVLGLGMHCGTLIWVSQYYRPSTAAGVLAAVIGLTLALGCTLPLSLPNLPPDAAQSRSLLEIESSGGADIARTRALEDTLVNEKGEKQWIVIAACTALAVLVLVGIGSRIIGDVASITYRMSRASQNASAQQVSSLNKPLKSAHLALAGLTVLVAFVVAGLYLAYPSPQATLEEMHRVQIELNLTLKSEALTQRNATPLVAQWGRLQSKLTLGDFLRRGRFNSPLRQPNEELRASIQKLRAGLAEKKSLEELNSLYADARQAATRCRQAVAPDR